MLTVTFLGTGTSSGVPLIGCTCKVCSSSNPKDNRLRSSILIQSNDTQIVIDTGPDFRQQMLTHTVNNLDAVLITHAHRDHTAGLDELRAYNFKTGNSFPVYLDNLASSIIHKQFDYIFSGSKYPGIPKLELHEIDENTPFKIKNLLIQPIRVMHAEMPVLGFRIGSFAYITDAKTISDTEIKKLSNCNTLVLNALRKEPHISHLTLDEALLMIKKLQPKTCYLTHASHQLGLFEDISGELPENVFLAYDGLKIDINHL